MILFTAVSPRRIARSLATNTLHCYCALCPLLADPLPLPAMFPSSQLAVIPVRRLPGLSAGVFCEGPGDSATGSGSKLQPYFTTIFSLLLHLVFIFIL